MADKKEEKVLDDIEKRIKDLDERIDHIEQPLKLIPAWMNLHRHSINELFAIGPRLRKRLESEHFDEVKVFQEVVFTVQVLKALEKELKRNKDLLWKDVRAMNRAKKVLIRIERDEIVLSEKEQGRIRSDVLGELSRLKTAEKSFNKMLEYVRVFVWKIREVWDDVNEEIKILEAYLKDKEIKKLRGETRMMKIEVEIGYILTHIVPDEGLVQKNLIYIHNTLLTLKSHVSALKGGAKYVTVPAA